MIFIRDKTAAFLGENKIIMKYKPSVFNYYFDFDDKRVGIFNTFSGAITGLTKQNFQKFKNFLEDKESLEPEIESKLSENCFIVPYVLDEYAAFNAKRIINLLNTNASFYRIVTTMDCNARCFYCYEGKSCHEYMDIKTAEQLTKFIIDHIENRKCFIEWFGGEPLMNTEVIDYISRELRDKLGDGRVNFAMITNASLADANIIEKMKNQWNLSDIQITLDGFSDEYNKRKNYISIQNPFELVINNIDNMLQADIKINIRLNYDKNNYLDLCKLIKYLGDKNFNSFKNLRIYAYPIFNVGQAFAAETGGWDEWIAIQTALIENKFAEPVEAFSLLTRKAQCYACSAKSFAVLPNGTLVKCTQAMKDKDAEVGDIWNGVINHDSMEQWCCTSLDKRCVRCCFLPICNGGCRAGIFGYTSDICLAQKNFIDKVLIERIKYMRAK